MYPQIIPKILGKFPLKFPHNWLFYSYFLDIYSKITLFFPKIILKYRKNFLKDICF